MLSGAKPNLTMEYNSPLGNVAANSKTELLPLQQKNHRPAMVQQRLRGHTGPRYHILTRQFPNTSGVPNVLSRTILALYQGW